MKLVIDISYYNQLTESQWQIIKDHCDGVIVRLCYGTTTDKLAAQHIEKIKKLGLPYAGYGWVDPTKSLYSQLDKFVAVVREFEPASMFNDYEQYWRDWAAYMRQDLTTAYATRFTPAQLNDYYSSFAMRLPILLGDTPIGSYSAEWFITRYAPKMADWVYKTNYWEARYMRYYNPAIYANIHRNGPFPAQDIKQILFPQVPIVKGVGRQFESLLKVQGFESQGYHLDWNMFKDDAFSYLFKSGSAPEEPSEDPIPLPTALYKVNTYAAWIREEPMGRKIGYKMFGQVVTVVEIIDAGTLGMWAKTPQGFMGMSTLKLVA